MSKFNLSADAPEFIPGFAAAAGGGGGAAATPVDATRNLAFETYGAKGTHTRTFNIRPMTVIRTEGLTTGHGPFGQIGTVYRGYDHTSDADSLASDDEAIAIGCHDNDYRLKKIVRPMPGVAPVDVGDFPNNIADYYWINDGKNDEYPWYVLGRLTNGAYFFFAASCTFSGFECEGQMALYAADNIQTVYNHGMSGAARHRFAACFDKGTREKIAADKKAAAQARVAQVQARVSAAAAQAKARAAKQRYQPEAGTTVAAAAAFAARVLAGGAAAPKRR